MRNLNGMIRAFSLSLAVIFIVAGVSSQPVFGAGNGSASAVKSAGKTDGTDNNESASKKGKTESADNAAKTNAAKKTDKTVKTVKSEKADGSVSSKESSASEKKEEEYVPFDEAIDSFYSDTGDLTDEAILESARRIKSDGDALLSVLDEDGMNNVMESLDAYEAAKVDYIMAKVNKELSSDSKKEEKEAELLTAAGMEMSVKDGVCREWDLQCDYSTMMVTDGSFIREMIPRFQITSCTLKDGVLKVVIDEWMTQGYGDAEGKGPENASSYIYNFTISLKEGAEKRWTPFEINGTETNFIWLNKQEVDPETESTESPEALYPVKSELSADAAAYAQIAESGPDVKNGEAAAETGAAGNPAIAFEINESAVTVPYSKSREAEISANAEECGTSGGLRTYYYSGYNADKAIAYANKYWKHYNRNYHEYVGLDCCNFVSQCLSAGGLPHDSTWFPNSVAWINVPATRRHHVQYGMMVTADNTSVRRGNPVYYDWQGDGVYDHTAICVGTNASGIPVVNAHTTNVYHAPWKLASGATRQTLLLNAKATSSPSYKKNSWRTVDGKVYYVDGNGNLVKSQFKTINGKRYYFNKSGVRVTGFFKVNGKYYYASVKTGYLLKGWQWIGGKVYYFARSNYARITKGKHKVAGYVYYFNKNGARVKGFVTSGGYTYYGSSNQGRLVRGWKKINGKWYYFNPLTYGMSKGWKYINGRKCYFNSKGVLTIGQHG